MAARSVLPHGKAKDKKVEVVVPVQIPSIMTSSTATSQSIKLKDPFEVTKLSMQQLRRHYGKKKPDFARKALAPGREIKVILAAAFDVATKQAEINEFRKVLTARTWGDNFSFWTIDLPPRRMIVKSVGIGWAIWRGINLGVQSKSIAYSDGQRTRSRIDKYATVDQEADDSDTDSSEEMDAPHGPDEGDKPKARTTQASQARVTEASVLERQENIQARSTDAPQARVVPLDFSNTRDEPRSRPTDTSQRRVTGLSTRDANGEPQPHPTKATQTQITGTNVNDVLEDRREKKGALTTGTLQREAVPAEENDHRILRTEYKLQTILPGDRVQFSPKPPPYAHSGIKFAPKLEAALIGAKNLATPIELKVRHWNPQYRFLTALVDGDEYIVDAFVDEVGQGHHFKQWLGCELGFNNNALAVASKTKNAKGKSSAPFVSQPQGKAPIQTLAIVPTKARTFSLLSEDESAEQRFRKPQSTKDADTPLPEWAYEEFGERIRRIHQHYHPSLPPFVEVSRSIRIFLRVRVILAKPDGSYPPANQLEDLTAYVTTRWWDTTCIYWTLDKGESRIIVSPKVHGIRQIYRRWNDTMGGFDLVPVAYGHIRNKRRKELFRNSSSEDESSERARPRARTTAATSGNQSHEHRVPTVMTTSAMRPRESGVLSTATAPTMQQQNRAPSFLTGANSLPVGAKERPGLDAGSNEKVGRLAKTYALDKNKNSVVSSSEKAVITQAGISDAAANISTISSDTRSTVQTVSTSQAETRANRQDDSREEEDPQSTLPRLQESGSTRANMPSPNSIRESISTPASMPPPGIPHPFADPNHMPPLPSSIPNQMPPQKKSNPTPTQTPPQVTSAAYQTPTQTPPQNHSASFYPPSVPTQPLGYPPGPFPMHHPPPAPYQQMMPVQIPSSNFQTPQYPPQQNLQAPLFHPLHYHHQTPQSSWRQSSSAATAQFPPTSTVNQPYYFPIPRQHPTSCLPATTQSASQHQQHQHQNDELRNVQARKQETLLQALHVYEARSRLYDTYLTALAEQEREIRGARGRGEEGR